MEPRRDISPERQTAYYTGMGLCIVGALLFGSFFITVAVGISGHITGPPPLAAILAPIVGFAMLLVGSFVMNVARRGTAGSGVLLNPRKAREDLEPWNRAAGGMANDSLEEMPALEKLAEKLGGNGSAPAVGPVVKVRCQHCHELNDEDAKFCKKCGAGIGA